MNDTPENNGTILICQPEEALNRISDEVKRQWFSWQPGILHHYGSFANAIYFGGLTKSGDRFVFVEHEALNRYRRQLLRESAQQLLGNNVDEQALEAYCAQLEYEIAKDPNPRPHAAFNADARSRQIDHWLQTFFFAPEWAT